MYIISKEFHFEYGHRVWNQKLNKEYSIDDKCVCRHLHGHHGVIKVYLESENLTDGMVTDFKHLNWFKEFVDKNLDHKFIIDINDPLYKYLPTIGNDEPDYVNEYAESFVEVDFIPTSENLCKWFYDIVTEQMSKLNIKVHRIKFNETPKSESNYYGCK